MVTSTDKGQESKILLANGDKPDKAAKAAAAAAALVGGVSGGDRQRVKRLTTELDQLRASFQALCDTNEKLKTRDKIKSNFLAVVSHELRTPISIIKGYNRMLLDEACGPVSEDQRQLLAECREGCDRMIRMIDSMLDLSKIESGKMDMNLRYGDLGHLVTEMVRRMETIAMRDKVDLTCELDSGLPQTLFDAEKIDQVLMNLLENAIKFSPAGGPVSVRVVCRRDATTSGSGAGVDSDDLSWLDVAVSDRGVGIPLEDQERIFMAFRQVPDASRLIKGTGLGLAIAKRIVEAHGGDIWVHSGQGQGSEFHFTLPVERARG